MENKDIICPDCECTHIGIQQFEKFGKCASCYMREITSKRKQVPYVKLKELSEEERLKVLHHREVKRKSAKKVRDEQKKGIKRNIQPKKGRVRIYTDEIIEELKSIANDNITPTELMNMLKSMHPDLPITHSNIGNVIVKHNIPHSSVRGRRPSVKLDDTYIETEPVMSADKLPDTTSLDDLLLVSNDIVENLDEKIEATSTNKSTRPLKCKIGLGAEPERFKPIRQEVESILQTKFKALGCSVDRDYMTDEYLSMLQLLIYLKENQDTVIVNRKKQQNIVNAYQSDALHEMENVVSDDGDTYFQDKMHILRNYRRYYERDSINVSLMKPILQALDLDTLISIYDKVQKNKEYVDEPTFKPLVDTTMLDKYTWVKSLDNSDPKASISIVNYNPNSFNKNDSNNGRPVTRIGMNAKTPPTSQLNCKTRKSLHIFRVSCKISGGGYGVFKAWYRDYECNNSKIALAYATNTLNQLAATRKGMIWTDLDVVELNVGPSKENNNIENKPNTNNTEPDNKPKLVFIGGRSLITNPDDEPNKKYYKITCQLSGGGVGVFKDWQRTYTCLNEIDAKKAADIDLQPFRDTYKGMLISNLKCTEIGGA